MIISFNKFSQDGDLGPSFDAAARSVSAKHLLTFPVRTQPLVDGQMYVLPGLLRAAAANLTCAVGTDWLISDRGNGAGMVHLGSATNSFCNQASCSASAVSLRTTFTARTNSRRVRTYMISLQAMVVS